MTEADRPAFATALAALIVVYDVEVSERRGRLYFEALADLSIEEVNAACARAIRDCRFFPRPAELLDFARPNRHRVVADEALWRRYFRAPRDPTIMPTIGDATRGALRAIEDKRRR